MLLINLYETTRLLWILLLDLDFCNTQKKESCLSRIPHHKVDRQADCSPSLGPPPDEAHCIQILDQQYQPCTFHLESKLWLVHMFLSNLDNPKSNMRDAWEI